jgi:hypothetical protein
MKRYPARVCAFWRSDAFNAIQQCQCHQAVSVSVSVSVKKSLVCLACITQVPVSVNS